MGFDPFAGIGKDGKVDIPTPDQIAAMAAGKMTTPDGIAEMAKMMDLRSIPDSLRIEFTSINWEWMVTDQERGNTALIFYMPVMPFIKFRIPFDKGATEAFADHAQRAKEAVNGIETDSESSSDTAA